MTVRRWIAGAAALMLAVQVVRVAVVDSLAKSRPADAASFWAGHPSVETQRAMIEIAQSAHAGKPVEEPTLSGIFDASIKAPLEPDPFLVRGVQAQLAGDFPAAEQAFLAAERRDPRSLPARYFLADQYFRNGDAERGLPQVAVLARLVPDGASKLAPYIASYAQDRANWALLRPMLRSGRNLEDASLAALAGDARNADAVLALADPRRSGGDAPWLPTLVASLNAAGEYRKAHRVWAAVSKVRLEPGSLIFDPRFTRKDAAPPFNWALTSSTVGLAERLAGRGLHVLYYGHEDGPLASQMLLLAPRRYRLETDAPFTQKGTDMLRWSLYCVRGNALLASAPLDQAIPRGWSFEVPSSCPAQRLELTGSSSDVAAQADITIRSVRLEPERTGG